MATILTIAVAPNGGTEPALFKAYADALAAGRTRLRLKILSFDSVRESAEALQARKVDLAVVRPNVLMPESGLTPAILRDQAVIVAVPDRARIKGFTSLAGKRVEIVAKREAASPSICIRLSLPSRFRMRFDRRNW